MADRSRVDGLLATWGKHIGHVPSPSPSVCPRCCGPLGQNYALCPGCARIFAHAPTALRSRVVPLSSTLEEGPWYAQLVQYKQTARDAWPLLGGLVARFTEVHRSKIERLLGGEATRLTVVPSKRGKRVRDQPLYRLLQEDPELKAGVLPAPSALLEHTGDVVPRQSYTPSAFRLAPRVKVDDDRIVLVEDSWTSGATAISAAGALLEAGAAQIIVLPIARLIRPSFWGDDHPYLKAMKQPYDVSHWPR